MLFRDQMGDKILKKAMFHKRILAAIYTTQINYIVDRRQKLFYTPSSNGRPTIAS